MGSEFKDLLIEQTNTISSIKRVLINFRKLSKPQVTLHKTKGRLNGLEALWERCQSLHVRLLQTATLDETKTASYFIQDEFLTAEDAYQDAADYLHETIGKFLQPAPVLALKSSDVTFRDANSDTPLHLPRIALPKFSGNFAEWENDRGLFESLVANNDSISNTQKLHYLKYSVTGEAALLINNIQISDTNYESAWKTLVEEYDDEKAIIEAYIQSFTELPVMKSESAGELRRLRDTVSSSLTALTNLRRPVNQWDDLIVYIISQKFSDKTREEWNL